MEPTTLIVRHLAGLQFCVERADGKSSSAVSIAAPDELQVRDRPDSNLLSDLRWYLERFLDYPYPPNIELAERVQDALGAWGKCTFEQLFTGQALLWYDRIRHSGLENLVLKIACDEPRVLAWPWEALCDPHGTTLAHTTRLERQLSKLHDPLPLPSGLPTNAVNILLVIARPHADAAPGFQAVSGPLVDWVRESRRPVHIDVLRPPTFAALQQRLAVKHGHYHIVHFDGHGGYGELQPPTAHAFGGAQGHLVFESADGTAHVVAAEELTALLGEHRIPIMVLNACRSAHIDASAHDPFASTAAALLKAGLRTVVAMSYNLYVSGAQQFVPAFYRCLLETGDSAAATRAGRRAMLERKARQTVRGEYPLRDWLVPVLYQQEPLTLPVQAPAIEASVSELPTEAQHVGDYGFIGRQDAIHRLERALLHQPAAGILIHGVAGVGKTTLTQGFLRWLQHTGGLGRDAAGFAEVRWFGFDDIRSADYVINELVTSCFGPQATSLPIEQKLPVLVQRLSERPLLMIWDNFDSAAGIENTAVMPHLIESDRRLLKDLLHRLRGGRSKVLITSRSAESWLTPQEAFRLPLAGLRNEDAWIYCNAVVRDLGLTLQREDPDIVTLLAELDGHPLALRSVLLRLSESGPRQLLNELRHAFAGQAGDASTQRIFAALTLQDRGLPRSFAPVLQLIGLHQRHIVSDLVAVMLETCHDSPIRGEISASDASRELLQQCIAALERGGLLHPVGGGAHSMHPALHGFLVHAHPAPESAIAAFVNCMAFCAQHLAPLPLHQQRGNFALHGANFRHALAMAMERGNSDAAHALAQSLGAFAQSSRDFATAQRLFEMIAASLSANLPARRAAACYQLGRIAEEQRDFATAERWYLQTLPVWQERGDEHSAACTLHQLGALAQQQRDFAAAHRWYLQSLPIWQRLGDQRGAALTYHNLGRSAEEQRGLVQAEGWYLQALAIWQQQGDEQGIALTSLQLGTIALERKDRAAAERWYAQALAIQKKHSDQHGAMMTCHQLGRAAQEQGDLTTAEGWYVQSLAISEKQGDEHAAATTYHQLGVIAAAQRDYVLAERWHSKSLVLKQKHADWHGAALTFGALGRVSLARGEHLAAGEWFLQALGVFTQQQALAYRDFALRELIETLRAAPGPVQLELHERCRVMGLDPLIEPAGSHRPAS